MIRFADPILTTLAAVVLLPLVSCRTPRQPSLRDADYPGTLQSPCKLPIEAVWQQRVTATWQAPGQPPQARGFDAAVQRRGDTLTVVGLSPMGSIGFSIEQRGDDIQVTNNIPEQMVIPPRFILLDVQRTFFPWFPEATAGVVFPTDDPAAPPGFLPPETGSPRGTRTLERDGERIVERWQQGRLQERTFTRLDGAREGDLTIRYEWGNPDWAVPTRAILDNGWFGYRLTIETSSETRLPAEERT